MAMEYLHTMVRVSNIEDSLDFCRTDLNPAQVHGVVNAPLGAVVTIGQLLQPIAVAAQGGVGMGQARRAIEIDLVVVPIE